MSEHEPGGGCQRSVATIAANRARATAPAGGAPLAKLVAQLEGALTDASPSILPALMADLERLRAMTLVRLLAVSSAPRAPEPDDRLLDVEAVRERLGGLSKSYVYEMLRCGILPSVTIGKHRFVRASTLTGFIGARETPRIVEARRRRSAEHRERG